MRSYSFYVGVFGFACFSTLSNSYAEFSVKEQLLEFHSNPAKFMNNRSKVQKYLQEYIPSKVNSFGEITEYKLVSESELVTPVEKLRFPVESIPKGGELGGDFVHIKNKFHEGLGEAVRPGRAEYKPVDNPEIILGKGNVKFKTLKEMEKKHLMSGRVDESPWSDDYWPYYTGQIAKRYSDTGYSENKEWAEFKKAILKSASSMSDMSPAEKYELLIGDEDRLLSNKIVAENDKLAEKSGGRIEKWIGLCAGWSAASISVKRPKHVIEVAPWSNGATPIRPKIPFFPTDIKALYSYLWTKVKIPTPFMGTRCEKISPAKDENGRILDEECFDTNPGAWHLAVVNQLGYLKKSMIIDCSYDYEVWNQPLYEYSYTYFNPQTLETVTSLKDATIERHLFTRDKFEKYRSKKAKKIVGIAMKLTYIAETAPQPRETDSEDKDRKVAVNYMYDLEIDINDEIIGGEWYTNLHPDFIWIPAPGVRPSSIGDEILSRNHSKWKHKSRNPIPESWHLAAMKSANEGLPVIKVLDELLNQSRKFRAF